MKTILLLSVLIISACANQSTRFDVHSDMLVAYLPLPGSKVFVEDKDSKVQGQLDKVYFENLMKETLKEAGFQIVDSPADSDYLLYFTHGQDKSTKIASKPIVAYSAPQSYNYNSYGSSGYSSGTITQNGGGQFNVVGSRTYSYDEYTHSVFMVCLDSNKAAKQKDKSDVSHIAWQMTMQSTENDGDSKGMFPLFLHAAKPRFMNPSSGRQTKAVYLKHSDPLFTNLKSIENRTPASEKK